MRLTPLAPLTLKGLCLWGTPRPVCLTFGLLKAELYTRVLAQVIHQEVFSGEIGKKWREAGWESKRTEAKPWLQWNFEII